jgi:chromosome segregation ATPase
MIPDDAIIEYSHLSQKSNLAERIRKMNGQGTPTEEERAVQEQAEAMEARLLELEMAETEGKIAQINAQAALTNAKVRDIETDGDDLELEIHKLEQTLMNAREERANKLKLAKLHTDANIQKASTDAGTRLTLAAVNGSSKSG